MRVLALNVRSGGSRSTAGTLIARIADHAPAVVVLSEFRDNPTGAAMRRDLAHRGYHHQAATEGHRGNGVLIAARQAFAPLRNPFGLPDDEYPHAVLQIDFPHVRLYGVYLPGQDRKRPHLRCFIAAGARCNQSHTSALAIGDFNSGRNETDIELNVGKERLVDEFSTADLYAELEQQWTEAWLAIHPGRLEFSWYPFRKQPPALRRNGWRIDKAFCSHRLLPRLRTADYDHSFRLDGLTDHSAIVVELAGKISG